MIEFDVRFEGFPEQMKKLEQFDQIADRRLTTAMTQSVTSIRSEVVPLWPVGVSGRSRNSIASNVTHEGPLSIVGKVGSTLKGEVYPKVIEFGRKPGSRMPPPEALERWVHLVMGVASEKVLSVAFLVARNIGRRGITAKKPLRTGFEKARSRVIGYFTQALELIAKDLSNGR
jgi:hypothetical protein